MKFTTFYFSGTGNTKWAVEQFNQIIQGRGHQGEMFSIDNFNAQNMEQLGSILLESDYVGFANPIYGANIPPIMRRFIELLAKIQAGIDKYSKPIYIINTFGYINAFGPIAAGRLFFNSGFKLFSYANILICNNISTPKLKSNGISLEKLDDRKEVAKRELVRMVDKILAGKRYITGVGPYLLPGILIRKASKNSIENNYKTFSVKLDTCTKCMLCVKKCPTQSIRFENCSFKFYPECTACMRCYNFCPTYSILIDGAYADPSIYRRYRGPYTCTD